METQEFAKAKLFLDLGRGPPSRPARGAKKGGPEMALTIGWVRTLGPRFLHLPPLRPYRAISASIAPASVDRHAHPPHLPKAFFSKSPPLFAEANRGSSRPPVGLE